MPELSSDMCEKKTSASDKLQKFAVMYGFNKEYMHDVGFLKVKQHNSGEYGMYDVVDDIEDATQFPFDGKTHPKKWLDFFNSEDELKNWKFHIVTYAKRKKAAK